MYSEGWLTVSHVVQELYLWLNGEWGTKSNRLLLWSICLLLIITWTRFQLLKRSYMVQEARQNSCNWQGEFIMMWNCWYMLGRSRVEAAQAVKNKSQFHWSTGCSGSASLQMVSMMSKNGTWFWTHYKEDSQNISSPGEDGGGGIPVWPHFSGTIGGGDIKHVMCTIYLWWAFTFSSLFLQQKQKVLACYSLTPSNPFSIFLHLYSSKFHLFVHVLILTPVLRLFVFSS